MRAFLNEPENTSGKGVDHGAPFAVMTARNWIRSVSDAMRWFFVAESVIITAILVNAAALFLDAFPEVHQSYGQFLLWIDYACIVYFTVEVLVKTRGLRSFSRYWRLGWNRLDFVIVVVCIPALITPFIGSSLDNIAILFLLRLGRLLRFFRVMRYVPNAHRILRGVGRAMKASVGILLVLLLINFIFALGATLLFGEIPQAQEYFGNPIRSMYSMFKVFTIEGWYEIPERLTRLGVSAEVRIGVQAYFTLAVLVGGLLGLSIANAIFVDEMLSESSEDLRDAITSLRKELKEFRTEYRRNQ